MDFGTICDPVQNVYMYIVNTLLTVILNIGVVPIVHSTHVQNANLQKNSGVFYSTTCHRAYIINVKKIATNCTVDVHFVMFPFCRKESCLHLTLKNSCLAEPMVFFSQATPLQNPNYVAATTKSLRFETSNLNKRFPVVLINLKHRLPQYKLP